MVYIAFGINDVENILFLKWWSQQSFIRLWPWLVKSWSFKVIYMKYHIYHLKGFKKLYKRHLNGKYRFLIRNRKIRGSKCVFTHSVWGLNMWFGHNFSTLIDEFCYFLSEIDMFRLNVFYITFWDISNGIHEFSYKWYWKCTFSGMMVRAIIHKVLTMTCEKLDFQDHLYEILCIPFERSQKVI